MFVYFRTGGALQLALALSVNLVNIDPRINLLTISNTLQIRIMSIYFVAHRTKYECAI
jgi:hypothetical protein